MLFEINRERLQNGRAKDQLNPLRPARFGWPKFDNALATPFLKVAAERRAHFAQERPSNNTDVVLGANVSETPELVLPKDKTVTISVIGGPSKGLVHQLRKSRISIGRTGGGTDIELDDPSVSRLHCALGVRQNLIRLCDLDSANGTYVNEERIQGADLENLSEFRIGSSLLLVTVLPTSRTSAL